MAHVSKQLAPKMAKSKPSYYILNYTVIYVYTCIIMANVTKEINVSYQFFSKLFNFVQREIATIRENPYKIFKKDCDKNFSEIPKAWYHLARVSLHRFLPVSLWRRANARNVRLYYPNWQYTNLFIFRFVSQLCLRSTLRLYKLILYIDIVNVTDENECVASWCQS